MMTLKTLAAISAATILLGTYASANETRQKANYPETDIFLLDLDLSSNMALSNSQNITPRKGYDNQPSFTSNSETILFSRGDDYQTDVYEYDIAARTTRQITQTSTDEFSPVASADNTVISFVTDGPATVQNIAKIDRAAPTDVSYILPGKAYREPTGYYGWDHDSGNVVFWSRYGSNVTLARTDSGETHYISGDAVPSTPYVIPGTSNFSFVHLQGNGASWIKEFNPKTKAVRPIAPLKGLNANYGWAPDGSILIIEDDVLYRWKEGETEGWTEVGDLGAFGIEGAARLSVSPDGKKIAVVGLPMAE